MRRAILTLLLATPSAVAGGQASSTSQPPPREIRREVVARWNAPHTTGVRAAGRLELEAQPRHYLPGLNPDEVNAPRRLVLGHHPGALRAGVVGRGEDAA